MNPSFRSGDARQQNFIRHGTPVTYAAKGKGKPPPPSERKKRRKKKGKRRKNEEINGKERKIEGKIRAKQM